MEDLYQDGWNELIRSDRQARDMTAKDLSDKYQCRKRLRRENTTLLKKDK